MGGNILEKKRHAYTEGEIQTEAEETTTYTYGNAQWKDQLTGITGNGTGTDPVTRTILYDAIGNPTNDGEWSYTWQSGRQLQKMEKGSAGTAGYKKLEYAYNQEGLRIQKKVTRYNETTESNDVTVTDYILHGKNIVHMRVMTNETVTDEMHFFYDAQGRPALTEHTSCASGITSTEIYAYIHNLQGDTVGLLDASGTECVRYTYDAWGRMISISGTKATTLGLLQPFRYRGYVYDEETGLFYLRSRYYNPTWNRFISADILINGNLYCYCNNSPSCNIDNDGQSFEWCGETYEYGDPKKRGNHRNRMPLSDYLNQIYQMIDVWKYPQTGAGCAYGYVDCTGIYEFPMYTYFDRESLLKYHANGNNTDRIYESGLYNSDVNGCVGKGKITGNTLLTPGMALFIYGYDQERKIYHLLHMAVYVGDYFDGYENAVIESVEGGVVIRTLEESENIHKTKYTYCGYFRGIDYAQ